MKTNHIKQSILCMISLVMLLSSTAQNKTATFSGIQEDIQYCGQHILLREMLKIPAFLKIHQAEQAQLKRKADSLGNNLAKMGTVYTIPVVFHIIHDNGAETISRAQVLNALAILNRDFRLQNPDANNVDSAFQGLPADAEIEFVLATKAPDGKCFGGITRTQSTKTVTNNLPTFPTLSIPAVDAVIASNNVYQGQWSPDKYLNIFVYRKLLNVAGYTFLPSTVFSGNMYFNGIHIRHDYLGSIGTSSVLRSRSLTHEVGHFLNLNHTWGATNTPGVSANCSTDDGISDTPNTIGVTSCNLGEATCGPLANVENYMDYSYCSKMFTPNQVYRMRATLQSVTNRNNLYTPNNLLEVGAGGDTNRICKIDFHSDKSIINPGNSVQFFDDSYFNITGWNWTFAGGTPSTSSSQNPSVQYCNPGTYRVSLIVTDNNNLSRIKIKNGYITVLPARNTPISEGFETMTLPDSNWTAYSSSNDAEFEIIDYVAATGNHSLLLENGGSQVQIGGYDEFISAAFDLSGQNDVALSYQYAFAQYLASNSDRIQVFFSNDCGYTWHSQYNLSGSQLATSNSTQFAYVPLSTSDWREVLLNIPTTFLNDQFRFKIKFVAGGGNNLYIDDINIEKFSDIEENRSIGEIRLFPNPAKDELNLTYITSEKTTAIYITDLLGKKVVSVAEQILGKGTHNLIISTSELSTGVYFVNLEIGDQLMTQKLIIE